MAVPDNRGAVGSFLLPVLLGLRRPEKGVRGMK
jgi:hypothetical protein